MIKVILTELNKEYGAMQIIDTVKLDTTSIEKAHEKGKIYTEALSDIRKTKVTYMLENKSGIVFSS